MILRCNLYGCNVDCATDQHRHAGAGNTRSDFFFFVCVCVCGGGAGGGAGRQYTLGSYYTVSFYVYILLFQAKPSLRLAKP